ncbi:MAG: 30S ribosomal protein S17 [candidate division Zixibacteria bacterium]|nr:30S ribosomal protein S17 [candidate division Zixibacteria bacterium]
MADRNRRKTRVGKVVSDKMDNTIVVEIVRTLKHPLYERIVKTKSRLHAHDQSGNAAAGDTVRVMECRPLSKTKRWRLVEIMEKAK